MPRTISITLSPEKTASVLEQLRSIEGVAGLQLQRGAGIQPPGDVVTVQATNEGTRAVLETLDRADVLSGGSMSSTEPRSLLSPSHQPGIDKESNETIWEEMASLLRRETNISANYLSLMGLCGGVAAAGLFSDTLHIVIGAMVIAPGFEPLLRVPFGLVGGPRILASRGLASSAAGYLLLALGAAATFLLLRVLAPGSPPSLRDLVWVRYWSTVTGVGALVSLLAGMAGAFVISAQRSVLSAGVMIALALVPAMSVAGMALAAGDLPLAGRGLLRWAVDVGVVFVGGWIVLGMKQLLLHKRRALA